MLRRRRRRLLPRRPVSHLVHPSPGFDTIGASFIKDIFSYTGSSTLVNARQARLLEILSHRDSITNREYSDLVGVSSRTGNRDLLELIGMGLIVKVGRRRAAVYRLP